MQVVSTYKDFELTKNQIIAIITLLNSVWPYKDKTISEVTNNWISEITQSEEAENYNTHFVIWVTITAIAHAKIFSLEIYTKNGSIKIAALASVCVSPNYRNKGLGEIVTKSAFDYAKQSSFPASLFQTAIPEFYKKLGSKMVNNKFINSKNEKDPQKNPFWDKCIMIYPAEYNWSESIIDLNGQGY